MARRTPSPTSRASYARQAFPCWDEPGFKNPFQLTLTVPSEHVAMSNTEIVRQTSVERPGADGTSRQWTELEFAETKPLPTYLVAFASGPLDSVPMEGLDRPARIFTPRGQSGLTELPRRWTPPLIEALERYFGSPYPFEKIDYVAVPEYIWGAMENPGAITFTARALLLTESASFRQRNWLLGTIVHENAHMWFGNLVTPAWWDDLWLNESFAQWIEAKIVDEVFPDYQYGISALIEGKNAMMIDAMPTSRAVRQPIGAADDPFQLLDDLAYPKGQAVLDMVESWIGEDVFRAGVLAFMERHAWGSATGHDLWTALSEAAGRDLQPTMTSFIEQPGLPFVRVESLGDGRVRFDQECFNNLGAAPRSGRWEIPIVFRYAVGGRVETASLLLTEPSQVVELETDGAIDWIHPNADERGYYRWSVPPAMLRRLAEDSQSMLSVPERVAFIGNTIALMNAGAIHVDTFIDVVRSFRDDPEAYVGGAVVGAVRRLERLYVTPELRPAFARFVAELGRPMLDRVGLERQPGEADVTTAVRADLVFLLGAVAGDADVVRFCEQQAAAFGRDPESVEHGLAEQSLYVVARHGDRALYEDFKRRFVSAETIVERRLYLRALSRFADPAIVADALAFALTDAVRIDEVTTIPSQITRTPELIGQVLDWVVDEYPAIRARLSTANEDEIFSLIGGHVPDHLQRIQEYFDDPERGTPVVRVKIAEGAERVAHCVSTRAAEGVRFAEALEATAR